MNRVVEELKNVKVFYVATIDNNQPRVRPFSSVVDIDGEAYICSGNYKEFYKQFKVNPNVELCGMYEDSSWLRVSATLVEDSRIEIQQIILDDPTGPSALYKAGDGKFVCFKLTNIKAYKYSFFKDREEIA